ncbi:hypothetical protein [Actinoplanes sp. GCM10030250]|uniref:hypothetical protein n=1 Tax=Actinoplanes sp. GCM10030250 TaxID=3273376 RepID=UPI003613C49A
MSLTDLRHGFRDEDQLYLAQGMVMMRLADDRDQEECRALMRFWWQLAMTYTEITEAELNRHLTPEKLDAVHELIGAIRDSPEAIDAWINAAYKRFPVVEDRGYEVWRPRDAS